ncbi:dTMP kinase [Acidisoma silvae]|uniref:Thymidylate kinase n=1 Tax=Acidisoma silvae TaxID=2802396 RepID=A0A963YTH3_9PROT|nr:dTMP kinase [Acidisoma silvae]MCB8876140.1 dTMP kinase [Acidisoma silvae]
MAGRPGRFIVFEGGDGAGKGSVLAAAAEALRADGFDILTTREPGGTPEGMALRALLLSEAGEVWDQGSELLLMTAARVQHMTRVIRPAVAQGQIVLCDRYVGSTLAYQGGGRGIAPALIRQLHADFVGDYWPDLTVLLDIPPAEGLRRSQRRLADTATDEGRFEGLALDFHERVRASFLAQAKDMPDRFLVADAAPPLASVQAHVLAGLRAWLQTSLTTG